VVDHVAHGSGGRLAAGVVNWQADDYAGTLVHVWSIAIDKLANTGAASLIYGQAASLFHGRDTGRLWKL
jgi:hypothetical protein